LLRSLNANLGCIIAQEVKQDCSKSSSAATHTTRVNVIVNTTTHVIDITTCTKGAKMMTLFNITIFEFNNTTDSQGHKYIQYYTQLHQIKTIQVFLQFARTYN